SVGTIFAFVQYVDSAFAPLFWFFGVLNKFERAMVSARRIFDMFLNVPSKELEFSTENPELKGNVEFRNLSFAYDNENYVLKNINLNIPAGNTIGIVGHTGSGKSSLMNVLLRFYDYQKGDIVIDGRSLRDYPVQTYRAHVGMVLQDPVLFSGTLFSNITFNNNDVTEERVLEIMSRIGAQSFIDKQPNGIHESVEDMGRNFSVGERQLIAFARVMVYDPEILILDEATANIDTETEIMIQKALNVISQNRTTFIIAHRLSTVKHADQLIVLNKGSIVERGIHEELVEKDGLYAKMYQSQIREEYTHEVLKNSKENFALNM
ncbi:MAG: ATP-binding cassette domain-containing protein, partial [Fusobacteriales bacterium]|nr:ATP-binding cassette domain-containing protein [Fusobacteriales bacterium]